VSANRYNVANYQGTDHAQRHRVAEVRMADGMGTMRAAKGLPMPTEKWLCWASLGVAAVLLLLFIPDLVLKIPFGAGISTAIDIVVIVAAAILAYLSWNALRDLR